MKTNLYIPKTITVGFQTRSDTFTGKLGYVIYTDHKGVLRKETSWNGWRDKKIDAVTVDNTPQSGFTLNKGVQRDGHWGSGRSVIRVWDPRDFEFEISVDNLIGILMHADVSKRDITEPCVFAWYGTELILLPTNSVEYQESVAHTAKQERKFSAKDLTPGYTYSVRKESRSVVYLGYFDRYEVESVYENERYGYTRAVTQTKKSKKNHVFIDPDTKSIFVKDPAAFISNVVAAEVHADFPALTDHYYSSAESQPAVGLTLAVPNSYSRSVWYKLNDTDYAEFSCDLYGFVETREFTFTRFARFDPNTGTIDLTHTGHSPGHSWYRAQTISPRSLPGLDPSMNAVVHARLEINRVTKEFKETFVPASQPRPDYSQVRELIGNLMTTLHTTLGVGKLQYVLTDGKLAFDHQL